MLLREGFLKYFCSNTLVFNIFLSAFYSNSEYTFRTQTLHRTLITSGTTLMVILMLYLFGGPVLEGFSLTMLIGVSIGTASSIYVASALALKLGMKREHMLQQKVEKEGADQPSILP